MKVAGGASSRAIACTRVLVGASRELNSSSTLCRVQGLSPMPAPDRLTTASAPASAPGSRTPAAGSHLISDAPSGWRRTSVTTEWPASRKAADMEVPMSPEAPAVVDYDRTMTSSSYFRFPHLHGDLVTFVAEDDVWIAPLDGGRAWRVSSLQLPARNPRFTPDGQRLVWTVVQGAAPEVVTADVDGGGYRQLSYFGHSSTKVKGFTPDGDVVVTSAFRQADSRLTHAYSLPVDGGWAEELPFGPVESVAFGTVVGDERPVVLASVLSREPAWWKRYRGGAAGKLWIDADGNGEFVRLAAALDGNLTDPLWVKGRIAFLSDHEGYGNLYSVLPNGSDLRRHTDHEDFYVRHAATDGERVVFESAGELWLLPSLDAEAVKLDIVLGSASQARRPAPLKPSKHLGDVVPDRTGASSAVESHGTVHWLRHKDGPSRVLEATPGVRARLPRPFGEGRIAYVADHDGVEALYLKAIAAPLAGAAAAASKAPQPAVQSAAESTAQPAASAEDAGMQLPKPVSAAALTGAGSVPAAANGSVSGPVTAAPAPAAADAAGSISGSG